MENSGQEEHSFEIIRPSQENQKQPQRKVFNDNFLKDNYQRN